MKTRAATPQNLAAVLAALLGAASAWGEEPARSVVELSAPVPAEQDGCLDHTVRELGMSAKRVEKERRWNIGPQFLHPSVVAGGALRVEMKAGQTETWVTVTTSWPGALKEKAIQAEVEERLRAMVTKMTQQCGVLRPALKCIATPAGSAAAACGK